MGGYCGWPDAFLILKTKRIWKDFVKLELFMMRPMHIYFDPAILLDDVDLVAAINAVYTNHIWPKLEPAYDNYSEEWKSKIREMQIFADQVETEILQGVIDLKHNIKVLPADYNPPLYIGTFGNMTNLEEEKQHYDATSEVRSSIYAVITFMRRSYIFN